MVESVGMQQVLQLSSVAVKAQMATQVQGPEIARAFDKELKKQTDREADKTHEITETPEEKVIREEGREAKQRAMTREPRQQKAEDDENEEQTAIQPETGQGRFINIIA